VSEARASLMASYPAELSEYGAQTDYMELFRLVFELVIDGRQGMSSLLECLDERLAPGELQVAFDDDFERATVHFAGRSCHFHWPGFHHETFDADMATLEALMEGSYVFRVFFDGGVGDAWEFLVVPASLWARAEKRYGATRLSVCLKSYGSPLPLDEPFDETLRWRAPRDGARVARLGLPVLLVACAGAAIPLLNLYNSQARAKANSPISCEHIKKKVFGKLKPEQANALIEDMRRRAQCT